MFVQILLLIVYDLRVSQQVRLLQLYLFPQFSENFVNILEDLLVAFKWDRSQVRVSVLRDRLKWLEFVVPKLQLCRHSIKVLHLHF